MVTAQQPRQKVQRTYHPLRNIWRNMKARCRSPNHKSFKSYGAKGVVVCERWSESFTAFVADVGPRPSLKHSLDRIENSKGYEPGNVRWATQAEQLRNQCRNRMLTHEGVTLCLTDWALRSGVGTAALSARLKLGWPVDRAITTPVRRYP